jgi:amidase
MSKINRRNFMALGAAVGAGVISGCRPGPPEATGDAGGAAGAGGDPTNFELAEMSIDDLREGISSGRWTCRRITEMYLARIEALNASGPNLRAVLETNPDALEISESLDRELREQGPRGPLHGIPLLLKDNIDTADKMTTTAGSTALKGSIAPQDAFVANRLRQAGAVLLGKANMSEWAGWKSFVRGTSGWSGRGYDGGKGGFCRNPYVLDRAPGGSSSGSGVSAAANLAAAAIGTETDGSIVGPSSRNGLVGLKPTIGLLSRGGVIPIAHSQDSTGPMARTVRDAAIILGTMTGVDTRDPMTSASTGKAPENYLAALDPNGLRGARIGVSRANSGFDDRVDKLFAAALDALKAQGAVIVDPVQLPAELRFGNDYEMEVLYHEFKNDLNAYLASLGPAAPIKSLKELIEYNEKNAALELSLFGQELLIRSEERGPLTDTKYLRALETSHRLSRQEGIDKVMDAQRLDAIVAPTSGIAEMIDATGASRGTGIGCSTPAAMAGYPIMTVPMGFLFGIPLGIAFFGRAWSESTLIKLAYAYEQATKHRKPPRFLPTAELIA